MSGFGIDPGLEILINFFEKSSEMLQKIDFLDLFIFKTMSHETISMGCPDLP